MPSAEMSVLTASRTSGTAAADGKLFTSVLVPAGVDVLAQRFVALVVEEPDLRYRAVEGGQSRMKDRVLAALNLRSWHDQGAVAVR